MFGVKVNGKFLDLGKQKFTVRLQNSLYFGDDAEVIQGSFLLTSETDITKTNQSILGNLQSLSTTLEYPKNLPAEIWANGSILFSGQFSVIETTYKTFKYNVIINSVASLKDLTLDQLQYPSVPNAIEACRNSVMRPDDFDFISPTIFNPSQYKEEITDFQLGAFQNDWESGGGTVVPFPKVTSIIRKAFERINFGLSNVMENTQEWRWLLLYFANPVRGRDENNIEAGFLKMFYGDVNLRFHVPSIKCNEFIKNIVRLFNLGIFADSFTNKAEIMRAEDILEMPARHDWTRKIIGSYRQTETRNYPATFHFPDSSALPNISEMRVEIEPIIPNFYFGVLDALKEGLYETQLVTPRQLIYNKPYGASFANSERIKAEPTLYQYTYGDTKFESKFSYLPLSRVYQAGNTFDLPCAKQQLDAPHTKGQNLGLFFFRGHDGTRSIASSEGFGIAANTQVAVNQPHLKMGFAPNLRNTTMSISFNDTQKGIFTTHFKKWVDFLKYKKEVEFNLRLSISDIRKFLIYHKVFIFNQNYLVKWLEFNFDERGLIETETRGLFIRC